MSAGKLPEGWVNTTIGDISVKCSQRVPDESEQFIYVDIGSINRELKVIENPQHLTGKDAPSRARKEIKAHDIIVSLTRPNLNAVALVSEKYDEQIASTGFEVIRPTLVESRYIFALVRSRHFIDSISGLVQGALYPAAKSSDVQSYKFPLPPLAEQKIIAEKLDTLLAQVDSTKARLEQIPQILKRFRQAILTAAISGRLTDKWRKLTDLQTIWKSYTLGELVTIDRGSSPRPIKDYITTDENGVNWIKIGDTKEGEKYIRSTKERITREGSKKSRKVTPGDFILSNSMSLGRAYIVEIEGYVHDGWFILRLPENIDKNYFYYLLSSSQLQTQFSSLAVGGVVQNIRSELVKQAIVNIPPLQEQAEIVRRIEQLFAYADTIEKQVNSALTRVNSLTQSILAKAFRGELTAQWRAENPDLISGENSAAALLEKIKAERAASGGKKTSRKKA
ncbi:type I restriction endonuclease subunit S [Citrobacter portucalensis]|uniref:restriction endonuclease subunit S n=1 Tax=Citrobacter portucalensis TaxID=1639133 RepID=UPI0009AE54FC|nr:restriction endonuclease subunit S [Citrobacter portucalensis]OPW94158.1 type I restriction endonuclease subunit S [Citrobacter portucalensis]